MQLFVCDFVQKEKEIRITDERIVRQCITVLRMKPGDLLEVQSLDGSVRHVVEITTIAHAGIVGTVTSSQCSPSKQSPVSLLIAFPNTRKKLHLIAQKLTEVGVSAIFFCRMDRSQMKEISDKKIMKLETIILEAVEQSRRWTIPVVRVVGDFTVVNDYDRVVVFDREKNKNVSQSKGQNGSRSVLGVVGPEGGLSDKDYEALGDVTNDIDILSLGDSVLRMETAAIVGGWMLVSSSGC